MLPFLAALRFLTVIPITHGAEKDGDYFKKSLVFFPLVGLIIGALGFVLVTVLLLFLPQNVCAVLAIAYLAFISGCLHMDGLSDSGDGLLSSRPRTRTLEIMKDSRVGAMGVIVTIFLLLGKYSALVSMEPQLMAVALFLMPFAGRTAILLTMAVLPYAREEGGLGTLFYSERTKQLARLGFVLFVVILLLVARSRFLVTLGILALLFFLFNRLCREKIGGATGDTLGANCELAEMGLAIAFSATFSF